MTSPDPLQLARELLAHCRTATLATTDEHGSPHAANIQFAPDENLNLYFISSPTTAHAQHLARHPRVALTIYHPDDTTPATIRGLQLHADCRALPPGPAYDRAWSCYLARFTFLRDNPQFLSLARAQTFYHVTPTWLRVIDNRRSFGWKAEVKEFYHGEHGGHGEHTERKK
ncbi:MAG: pyridoxamine 5'-phosphate oxidase family protein [Phycisphaeraceae bacterium]|nr:pyridoxamine 5'-phosphate oxidase family protein [Phycisphaeraceae bacterium]